MFFDYLSNACSIQNLSVTKATTTIGVSKGNITRWKNGASPTAEIIVHFSKLLNVSCDYLLTGQEHDAVTEYDAESDEAISMYSKLDKEDKSEIRGYIRGMLRAEKYQKIFTQDKLA